jgi:hypothetical protein
MRAFALVLLVVIVSGRTAAWLVSRRRPAVGETIRLSTLILTHVGIAVILASVALAAAQEDGPLFVALAVIAALLAFASLALAGLFAWGLVAAPPRDDL